jgi:hypothetical protein
MGPVIGSFIRVTGGGGVSSGMLLPSLSQICPTCNLSVGAYPEKHQFTVQLGMINACK